MSEHASSAALGTAAAPPIVSGKPEEIADGVFVVPDGEAIFGILEPQLRARYADWDASEPWRIATGIQSFVAR
jgi:hypothetical protein